MDTRKCLIFQYICTSLPLAINILVHNLEVGKVGPDYSTFCIIMLSEIMALSVKGFYYGTEVIAFCNQNFILVFIIPIFKVSTKETNVKWNSSAIAELLKKTFFL